MNFAWAAVLAIALPLGCSTTTDNRTTTGDGLDSATLPVEVRPDYEVFANRCSKCHALSRPLASGIDDDEYWQRYVERMRLQPGSGISLEDEAVILRFLRYFSATLREKKLRKLQGLVK